MSKVIIISNSKANSDTYCIKDLLKANGFKWASKAKRWFTDFERKAEVVQLLDNCNLSEDFHIKEVQRESLFNSFHAFNIADETIGLSEAAQLSKVSARKIRSLIAKKRIIVKFFELDSLGRKVNRRLDRKDVRKELGI